MILREGVQSLDTDSLVHRLGYLAGTRANDSLAQSFALADTGNTVHLASDEFTVDRGLYISGSRVTVKGGACLNWVGDGTCVTISGSDIVIEGLRLKNNGAATSVAVKITGSRVVVRDCTFVGFAEGVQVSGATGFIIQNCYFQTISSYAIRVKDTSVRGIILGNIAEDILMEELTEYCTVTGNNTTTVEYWAVTGNVSAGNVGTVTIN